MTSALSALTILTYIFKSSLSPNEKNNKPTTGSQLSGNGHFYDTFSVHQVPHTNVRAAIVTKTTTVFREADDLNIATAHDKQYVTWGCR